MSSPDASTSTTATTSCAPSAPSVSTSGGGGGSGSDPGSDGPASSAPRQAVPTDVHAIGNTSGPRPPRIAGVNTKPGQLADLTPNAQGNLEPPRPGEAPQGASTFGDPKKAPVSGKIWKVPKESELPEGLGIVADGSDVGGTHAPTHHTIYPTREMPAQEFLDKFNQIPWQAAGKK